MKKLLFLAFAFLSVNSAFGQIKLNLKSQIGGGLSNSNYSVDLERDPAFVAFYDVAKVNISGFGGVVPTITEFIDFLGPKNRFNLPQFSAQFFLENDRYPFFLGAGLNTARFDFHSIGWRLGLGFNPEIKMNSQNSLFIKVTGYREVDKSFGKAAFINSLQGVDENYKSSMRVFYNPEFIGSSSAWVGALGVSYSYWFQEKISVFAEIEGTLDFTDPVKNPLGTNYDRLTINLGIHFDFGREKEKGLLF